MIETTNLGQFFKEMYALSKEAKDADDFTTKAAEKFGSLIEAIAEKIAEKIGSDQEDSINALRVAAKDSDEKIAKLEATVKDYEDKLLKLEKRVKSSENREKRAQKAKVANNIIVKTSRSSREAINHVVKSIAQGLPPTANKPTTKDISFEELIPRGDVNNQGGNRSNKTTYKVFLTKEQKAALFAGLPAINKAGNEVGVSIQNEIPFYLKNYHKDLERVAYTLRTKFKDEKLRTKIIPDGLTLQMQFKLGGATEWSKASCETLSEKLDSIVIFREDEKKPLVLPTCKQVLSRKDNFA